MMQPIDSSVPVNVLYQQLKQSIFKQAKQLQPFVESMTQAPITLDHAYIATDGTDTYEALKQHNEHQGGKTLMEVVFKGRRLARWLNFEPIDGTRALEVGEPKPGHPENTHVAHIAFRISDENAKTIFETLRERLKQGFFRNARFLQDDYWDGKLTGVKLKHPDHPVQIEVRPDSLLEKEDELFNADSLIHSSKRSTPAAKTK